MFSQILAAPGTQLSDGRVTPNGVQVGLGVELASTSKQFANGSLSNTGNNMDVSIEGEGFFQVQMPDGSMAYTRDGHFQVDGQTGELVTSKGYSLYPNINIGTDIQSLAISQDGTVTVVRPGSSAQADNAGNIRLAKFANPGGLIETSDNLFKSSRASGQAVEGAPVAQGFGGLRQGFLEQSNVKVVEEIVNMITAQRAYEASSNVIKASDEMLRQANNLLS